MKSEAFEKANYPHIFLWIILAIFIALTLVCTYFFITKPFSLYSIFLMIGGLFFSLTGWGILRFLEIEHEIKVGKII